MRKVLTDIIIVDGIKLSILIIKIVILISFGNILDCLSFLFLRILNFYPILEWFRDGLMDYGLIFSSDDIKPCIVLLYYILGSHIPINLLILVLILQLGASLRLFVGMSDRVVAESG